MHQLHKHLSDERAREIARGLAGRAPGRAAAGPRHVSSQRTRVVESLLRLPERDSRRARTTA
ncbi:MAG TPA: hypothetical protein VH418_10600 [Solirubrobacteraceae bacterium]|jgi:hypothetical protein